MASFRVVAALAFAWSTLTLTSAMNMTGPTDSYWAKVRGDSVFKLTGITRRYYIMAQQVVWDYAPNKTNYVTGGPFSPEQAIFTTNAPGRIGSRYVKCLYRGYTDATFTKRLPVPVYEQYLNYQGPVIRAEVGDSVRILYRNNCSFPNSVHVHGFTYGKANEGATYGFAGYNDGGGTFPQPYPGAGLTKGEQYEYVFQVPEQAGPGPDDGSSVMWMYHSHTDEVTNAHAGLIGSIVVTRKGMARPDGSPMDVDREVFTHWSIINENQSPYINYNIDRFVPSPRPAGLKTLDEFIESNLKHAVNGYLYANHPMINVCLGSRVRWYLMGMGSEQDLHTPHWHGNVVMTMGQRMDVVNLLPATMVVADMVPYNRGQWAMHCHVNDHLAAGMILKYDARVCPLQKRK